MWGGSHDIFCLEIIIPQNWSSIITLPNAWWVMSFSRLGWSENTLFPDLWEFQVVFPVAVLVGYLPRIGAHKCANQHSTVPLRRFLCRSLTFSSYASVSYLVICPEHTSNHGSKTFLEKSFYSGSLLSIMWIPLSYWKSNRAHIIYFMSLRELPCIV